MSCDGHRVLFLCDVGCIDVKDSKTDIPVEVGVTKEFLSRRGRTITKHLPHDGSHPRRRA